MLPPLSHFTPGGASVAGGSKGGAAGASAVPSSSRTTFHLPPRAVAPSMDVVLLLSTAPPAPVAPLTGAAAMRARMLAMQAARRAGQSAAAAGAAAAQPKAGVRRAELSAELWRTGEVAEQVWKAPLMLENIWTGEGDELCIVKDVAWAPDAQTVSLLLTVQLTPSGAAAAAASHRQARTFVSTHLLATGARQALFELHSASEPAPAEAGHRGLGSGGLLWCSGSRQSPPPACNETLARLPPLAEPLDPSAVPSSSGRLMPHQAGVMRGRAPATAASSLPANAPLNDASGVGPALARLPRLARISAPTKPHHADDEADVGHARRAGKQRAEACSMLLAWDASRLHVLLEGAAHLGSCDMDALVPRDEGTSGVRSIVAASLSADLCTAFVAFGDVTDDSAQALGHCTLALPFGLAEPGESSVGPSQPDKQLSAVQHLAQQGSHLRALLLHTLTHLSHLKTTYAVHQAHVRTWNEHLQTASEQYATNARAEICAAVVMGNVRHALESLFAGNEGLTLGVLEKMRDEMLRSLDRCAEAAGRDLTQAAERLVVVLTELLGCARWPERYGTLLRDQESQIEEMLSTTQAFLLNARNLQELCELESLAFEEFFEFWLLERERQDRQRLEARGEAPSTTADGGGQRWDTLTVLELVRRGFANADIDGLILGPAPSEPPRDETAAGSDGDAAMRKAQARPSLQETMAKTRARLASPLPEVVHFPDADEVHDVFKKKNALFVGDAARSPQRARDRALSSLEATCRAVLDASARLFDASLGAVMPLAKLTSHTTFTLPTGLAMPDRMLWSSIEAAFAPPALHSRMLLAPPRQADGRLFVSVIHNRETGCAKICSPLPAASEAQAWAVTAPDGSPRQVHDGTFYGRLLLLLCSPPGGQEPREILLLLPAGAAGWRASKSFALEAPLAAPLQLAAGQGKGTLATLCGSLHAPSVGYWDFSAEEEQAEGDMLRAASA